MLLILERNEKFKTKFEKYFTKAALAPQCFGDAGSLLTHLETQAPPAGILVNLHGMKQLESMNHLRVMAHHRNIPLAFLYSPQAKKLADQLRKNATRETYFELPCKLGELAGFFKNPQTSFDGLIGKEIGPEGLKVKILRKLGAGAMGAVYEACQNTLDRRVAVKFLKLDYLANDSDAMLRFQNEAKAVAQLRSDHILHIYFTGFHNGQAYSVMEYIDGSPLDRVMKKTERLKPAQALKLAAEILRGLKEAHEHGIIHRDIKPANVMLNSREQAVILDFGLVRSQAAQNVTQTNALLGTPRYMAPEQISGQQIDHRADLYALGIMLFEMLVGQPPFQGNDIVSLLMKHVHEPLPHPETMGVRLDARIFQLVEKLCAKNRDQRIQSAAEGLTQVNHLLSHIKDVDSTATLVLHSGNHTSSDKLFLDSGDIASHDSFDAENKSVAAVSSQPSLHSVTNISLSSDKVPEQAIEALLDLFTEFLGPLARRLAAKQAKQWDLDLKQVPAKKWSVLLNGLGEMIENPTKQELFLDRAVLLKKSF